MPASDVNEPNDADEESNADVPTDANESADVEGPGSPMPFLRR
jgi:hypothetical protein